MGAVATLLGWLIVGAISYLQPLLIPVAIAAILAYLLEPLVEWLENRRLSRTMSVIAVFSVSIAIVAGILIYIIPAVGNQAQQFATQYAGIHRARPDALQRHDRERQATQRTADFPKA